LPIISTFHNTDYPAQTKLTTMPIIRHLRYLYSQHALG
jgi:hypothetical protein